MKLYLEALFGKQDLVEVIIAFYNKLTRVILFMTCMSKPYANQSNQEVNRPKE